MIYIVSGIEPSKKGAGRFLKYFIELFNKNQKEYRLNYIKTPDNGLIRIIKKTILFKSLKNVYYIINQIILKNCKIQNSTVFLFHPQSYGYINSIELIDSNKKIYFYVLDNSYFCIKSYNYLNGSNACFLCIKDLYKSQENKCISFPNNSCFIEYRKFILALENNLKKITFLTQNSGQSNLVRHKFGRNVSIQQIGMFTGEIDEHSFVKETDSDFKYDFVFHNTLADAKGINYFLGIAKQLSDNSFIIPYSKSAVERYIKKELNLNNITFHECSWETGLQDLIVNSKICISPSLWSAPIEGALLKSLVFSKCVAVTSIDSSFYNELPENVCIHLPQQIEKAAIILKENLNRDFKHESFQWIRHFISENNSLLNDFVKSI